MIARIRACVNTRGTVFVLVPADDAVLPPWPDWSWVLMYSHLKRSEP